MVYVFFTFCAHGAGFSLNNADHVNAYSFIDCGSTIKSSGETFRWDDGHLFSGRRKK